MTWRLLYVRAQCEGRYQASLSERQWPSYVPRETVWRGSGPRRAPALKPLLPGYVFADLTDEQLAVAIHLPDALYCVRAGDGLAVIPEGFIGGLRRDEARGRFDHTRRAVREAKLKGKALPDGSPVMITTGAFEGHSGIVRGAINRHAAYVEVMLFGSLSEVRMDFADLQAILPEEETLAA